jgi:hypothetical protein
MQLLVPPAGRGAGLAARKRPRRVGCWASFDVSLFGTDAVEASRRPRGAVPDRLCSRGQFAAAARANGVIAQADGVRFIHPSLPSRVEPGCRAARRAVQPTKKWVEHC